MADSEYDVAVVGGGLVGVSTAWGLAREGCRVHGVRLPVHVTEDRRQPDPREGVRGGDEGERGNDDLA